MQRGLKGLFMKQIGYLYLTVFMVSILFSLSVENVFAQNEESNLIPRLKPDGHKWRIGYLEGGPYLNYKKVLAAMVKSLSEMGWTSQPSYADSGNDSDTESLWKYLSNELDSDYIEFVENAYWSSGWDVNRRKTNKDIVIERLAQNRDIDLMIAMGTHAGQDLANNLHNVSTIVCSTSDAIRAGIVKSAEHSGFDHIVSKVDPLKIQKQIRLFHNVTNFKKLGVVFADTPTGRTYSGIDDIVKLSDEIGFQVFVGHSLENTEFEEAKKSILKAFDGMLDKIDAFYMTSQLGVSPESIPQLLVPLLKNKIFTFSQGGVQEVEQGVLLSMGRIDWDFEGRFYADVMAEILNGKKPGDINQISSTPTHLAINLKTAEMIGWDIPLEVLDLAENVFHSNSLPDDGN